MPTIKIIEEKPISLAEVKEEIKAIKKRDSELSFRTAKVSEQLDTIKVLKAKDAEELYKKIEKLNIPRMKEACIFKIVDLIPSNATEVKNIAQSFSLTITNENINKILEVVSEFKK